MDAKFAVLEYAGGYDEFIHNRMILRTGSKALKRLYIRKKTPYKASEISILGVDGLNVTLPITEADAESDEPLKDEVFGGVLEILRQSGIRAVKAGANYSYDAIIPAASGFYILPFILPLFLRKSAKLLNKNLSEMEVLIIDGMPDLAIDALCIISNEVNHITVFTENTEFFQNAAYGFLYDSGLNINVTGNRNDSGISGADVILNAYRGEDRLTSRFRKGAVFLDMAGNKKMLADVSSKRADITAADGIELKKDGRYISNVLMEAVMLASSDSFRRYVFGKCGDKDFYNVLDYIENGDFIITTFLRGGKKSGS